MNYNLGTGKGGDMNSISVLLEKIGVWKKMMIIIYYNRKNSYAYGLSYYYSHMINTMFDRNIDRVCKWYV